MHQGIIKLAKNMADFFQYTLEAKLERMSKNLGTDFKSKMFVVNSVKLRKSSLNRDYLGPQQRRQQV